MNRPDVSILLLSWNTCELTLECLDSLPSSVDDDVEYEIIVVDNGSRDGSVEALRRRSDITLVENAENRGYAPAVNQAYAMARGELILLLNSDAVFAPGALSALVRFLEEHPTVAGVGPLYLNPDGSFQAHHFRFPTFAMALANASALLRQLAWFSRRYSEYEMLDVDFSRPQRVPQPSATCLLLRRSAIRTDELMDERYPIFFNDVALARSLARAGEELWMTPESVVFHERSSSTRQLGGALKRQYIGSVVRYLTETESRSRVLLYRGLVLVQGLVLRLLRRPRALPLRDLWLAVRGEPGPIPQAPALAEVRSDLQEMLTGHGSHRNGDGARSAARPTGADRG